MRIQNNPLAALQKIYEQHKKPPVNSNVKAGAKDDGVEFSIEARFFNAARKALNDLPDTKTKDLEKLKEAVKTGSYHVKDEEIAERIIQESTLDELI